MKVLSTFLVLLILTFQIGCSTPEKKELVLFDNQGDRFISYLTAEDFKAAHNLIFKGAAKTLNQSELKNNWEVSSKDLGKFVEVKQVYKSGDLENYFIHFDRAILPLSLKLKEGKIISVSFGKKYPTNKKSIYINSSDGLPINVLIQTPTKSPKKIVLFIHDSGKNDWNERKSKLFKNIATALNKSKIATVRYHKRSFEMELLKFSVPVKLKRLNNAHYKNNFMTFFIEDAKAVLSYIKKVFPKSEVIIFGHGQGTWIALQMAYQNDKLKKMALLGSYNNKINQTALEKTVYNLDREFSRYDKNKNGKLTRWELRNNKKKQSLIPLFDLNKDKMLSQSEWSAGNYTNYYNAYGPNMKRWLLQEINYPSPYRIISQIKSKILFLHGELDNQTPIYFPRSIQILNNTKWKKNLSFKYFNKLGHNLNHQESFMEFDISAINKKTLSTITKEIMAL
ncbi:MAG: hypothetical protein KAG61_11245 [Bacteriovoracaceae bacterium]|nr:hypothetical protein [Bacteriovoracaceae bacterium]